MKCPHCRNSVLQKSGEVVRLRTHGPVEFHPSACRTKCHWCKKPVEIPVFLKSGGAAKVPERFILRKGVAGEV